MNKFQILGLVSSTTFVLMIGCNHSDKEKELSAVENQKLQVLTELRAKEDELAQLKATMQKIEDEQKSIRRESSEIKGELENSKKEYEEKRTSLEKLKKEFEDYKLKYKISARKKYSGFVFDSLSLEDGRKLIKAKVSSIEDDALTVLHSEGSARISVTNLSAEIKGMLAIDGVQEAAVVVNSGNESEALSFQWMPKSVDDVVECSLMVIGRKISEGVLVGEGHGSAFICNIGNTSYIYTNAHVIDGLVDLKFQHANGRLVDDFEDMEIAKSPYGYNEGYQQGGDVVRIRLRNFRSKALRMAVDQLTRENLIGSPIWITGNTQGRREITKLEGKITNIKPRNILVHNAPTQGGNSGSPIVRKSDYKVIGIFTWGIYDENKYLHNIWRKASVDSRNGIEYGPLLYDFEFESTSLTRLSKQRRSVDEIQRLVRMLGLMDALIPLHQGLFVNRSQKVAGDYSVGDILEESSGHSVIGRLVSLDRLLATKYGSKIPYSNKTILGFYHKTIRECTADIARERQRIQNEIRFLHFFYQGSVKRSKAIPVCIAYETSMLKVLEWYDRQASLRADPLPLSQRVRLPSIEGGFAHLLEKE